MNASSSLGTVRAVFCQSACVAVPPNNRFHFSYALLRVKDAPVIPVVISHKKKFVGALSTNCSSIELHIVTTPLC